MKTNKLAGNHRQFIPYTDNLSVKEVVIITYSTYNNIISTTMMKTVSHLFLLAAIICFSSVNAFVSNNNGVARKSSQLQMTILSAGGKKADFKEGSPLKNACAKLGVKPKYSCKK